MYQPRNTATSDVCYFSRVNWRYDRRLIGIKRADRRSHIFILGKTGTGKTTVLRSLAISDLSQEKLGLALLDPHGDLLRELASEIPAHRRSDLIVLGLPGKDQPWSFNPLAGIPASERARAVAGILEVFEKIWPEDWGPRLEHLFRNALFTLLERQGSSLADVARLLTDRDWRRTVVSRLENEEVRSFWEKEYAGYSPAFRAVVTAPLQNKLGAYLTDPRLRNILSAPESSFDLGQLMDEGKILLVNLSKGFYGEGPARLIGSLLVAHIGLHGLARAGQLEEERRDFFVHIDEFQNFSTRSFASMLSELRKYRIGLTLATQYLSAIEPAILDAVIGNAGTILSFCLGARDAHFLAEELGPPLIPYDLMHLPNHHMYIRLMLDGQPTMPFSGETLDHRS